MSLNNISVDKISIVLGRQAKPVPSWAQTILHGFSFWEEPVKNMIGVFQDFVEQFVIGCTAKRLKKISIVAIKSKFVAFFQKWIDSVASVYAAIAHHAGEPYIILDKILAL